jgi:hypothetical protein
LLLSELMGRESIDSQCRDGALGSLVMRCLNWWPGARERGCWERGLSWCGCDVLVSERVGWEAIGA